MAEITQREKAYMAELEQPDQPCDRCGYTGEHWCLKEVIAVPRERILNVWQAVGLCAAAWALGGALWWVW